MELKYEIQHRRGHCRRPLIEPYGIEIQLLVITLVTALVPLIEPYGIEIAVVTPMAFAAFPLIEPYGIEIANRGDEAGERETPLIEPYGIEIAKLEEERKKREEAFNRTLWN